MPTPRRPNRARPAPRCLSIAVLVLSFVATTDARACVPSIANSETPALILLVGHAAGTPDPLGEFVVVVRDCANYPVANATVLIDFSQDPDARLASGVGTPGMTVDCVNRVVRQTTDANGRATFRIVGAASGLVPSCYEAGACAGRVDLYADGVRLRQPRVASFDFDGSGGVAGADLALWLDDFAGGLNPARADYDGDGAVGGADLAAWLEAYGAGGSGQSGPIPCP